MRNGRRGVLVHKISFDLALHERIFVRSLCLGCLFDGSLFFSGGFFAAFHLEARDRIANTEGTFVAQELARIDGVGQRACHHLERAQSAFGRLFAKEIIEGEQIIELSRAKDARDVLVELRTCLIEAIGAIVRELVRQVPACDQDDAAPEDIRGQLETAPHHPMLARRKP